MFNFVSTSNVSCLALRLTFLTEVSDTVDSPLPHTSVPSYYKGVGRGEISGQYYAAPVTLHFSEQFHAPPERARPIRSYRDRKKMQMR